MKNFTLKPNFRQFFIFKLKILSLKSKLLTIFRLKPENVDLKNWKYEQISSLKSAGHDP